MKKISERIKQIAPEVKELTLKIHSNPELGREEFKACEWQVELLRKHGFEVEENFIEIATAFDAVYKGKKPGLKIGMLSEYDALPELGHACGHNLIAMVAVASGIVMKDLVDEYGGEIHVIGTPAEETRGAKIDMAEKGVFKDFDFVMMSHPAYGNADSPNTMASNTYKFEYFGAPAHAAGAPYLGVNALDAVISLFNMVNALRQQTKEEARIHGIIQDGGVAPNIIPDHASALFYVRANGNGYLEELAEKVIHCAEAAALGTGTRLEVSNPEVNFMATRTNMALNECVCENLDKLGIDYMKFYGKTMPGSSDMGNVSYSCPAIQNGFKIGEPKSGNPLEAHTVAFREDAAKDLAIKSGLKYVKAFAMTVEDIMKEPEKMNKIREEFEKEIL
ncbi:MAG: M20 family metallopeptidase [Anaerovoracaceae bacterium]